MSEGKTIFDDIRVDGKKGRDISLGGAKRAARATQRLPQAVVKVSSYSHGQGRAAAHLDYISRNSDLTVEDPQGNHLASKDDLKERMDEWATDFDTRKRSRDTVNIVLSAPEGSELGAVENSVRQFAQKTFGNSNDYLFAIHNDTDHPHGHLMVKMRGYDGEKLNPGKADLKQWREGFAEALRENGVQVDATTRAERGQGRKSTKQALYHLRQRETPRVDREAVRQLLIDSKSGVDQAAKPWAVAAKKRTELIREGYSELAGRMSDEAKNGGSATLKALAKKISNYAQSIPEPKTRGEQFQEQRRSGKEIVGSRDGGPER